MQLLSRTVIASALREAISVALWDCFVVRKPRKRSSQWRWVVTNLRRVRCKNIDSRWHKKESALISEDQRSKV